MSTLRTLTLLLIAWISLAAPVPALATGPEASAAPARVHAPADARVQVPPGWATRSTSRVAIHAPPRHARLMEVLLEHADASVEELGLTLGVPRGGDIHVFVSSTDAQFREVQPGEPPTWADATAYPRLGAVYLRAPLARAGDQAPLTRVLDHELVHVLVGRAFAPERPPTWVQEGLAQFYAEPYDLAAVQKLARTASTGPVPLARLEAGFPDNPHSASLAYAQSFDFFVWMERTYGARAVPTFVHAMADGAPLHKAIEAATGEPLYRVERAWLSRFAGVEGVVLQLSQATDAFWLLAALIGLVAMFVVRRRQRKRRDGIAAAEARENEAVLAAIWEGRLRPQRAASPVDPEWLLDGSRRVSGPGR